MPQIFDPPSADVRTEFLVFQQLCAVTIISIGLGASAFGGYLLGQADRGNPVAGPMVFVIPDVGGMEETAAVAELQAAGFPDVEVIGDEMQMAPSFEPSSAQSPWRPGRSVQ